MADRKDNSEFSAIESYDLDEVDKLNTYSAELSHLTEQLEHALDQGESKSAVETMLSNLIACMEKVRQQSTLSLMPINLAQANMQLGVTNVLSPGSRAHKKIDKTFYEEDQDDEVDEDK